MIINELAYKVTIKADEFLNGKRKVKDEVSKLNKDLSVAEKERLKELENSGRKRRGSVKPLFQLSAT